MCLSGLIIIKIKIDFNLVIFDKWRMIFPEGHSWKNESFYSVIYKFAIKILSIGFVIIISIRI